VITWHHDEVIFYVHDCRGKGWHHKNEAAKPYAKGDGVSLMIADFCSADFGWLHGTRPGPDGAVKSAQRIMRPGKNWDRYFSAEDIEEQAQAAMDIVTEFYPEFEHAFIFDNATTHLKHP
jgi:hypothetical protein